MAAVHGVADVDIVALPALGTALDRRQSRSGMLVVRGRVGTPGAVVRALRSLCSDASNVLNVSTKSAGKQNSSPPITAAMMHCTMKRFPALIVSRNSYERWRNQIVNSLDD